MPFELTSGLHESLEVFRRGLLRYVARGAEYEVRIMAHFDQHFSCGLVDCFGRAVGHNGSGGDIAHYHNVFGHHLCGLGDIDAVFGGIQADGGYIGVSHLLYEVHGVAADVINGFDVFMPVAFHNTSYVLPAERSELLRPEHHSGGLKDTDDIGAGIYECAGVFLDNLSCKAAEAVQYLRIED